MIGGALSVLGLSVPQALTVVVLGNSFWLFVGYAARSGAASGTPSSVITRAIYGVKGNRYASAGISWLTSVAYEGINLATASLVSYALLESMGVSLNIALKIAVAAVIGVATFGISIYGHATIVRSSWMFSVSLGISLLVLGGFVLSEARSAPADYTPLQGADLGAALRGGLAVVVGGPLSYSNGADYARYLPAT
ncbi:cytosine permease, partial [Streptomyces sp. 4F14]|uniref:cytosine permease n=1 Tax=Streptomyces sp. 4F14 TaxID=3394380 RepID=UPI003A84E5D9